MQGTQLGIQLIVGLGNPGAQYEATRHNAGFWWVDMIAGQNGARLNAEGKFQGVAGRLKQGNHEAWLLKPSTFMNASGRSVAAIANFYKISPHNILVVHDELDLGPGTVKLSLYKRRALAKVAGVAAEGTGSHRLVVSGGSR